MPSASGQRQRRQGDIGRSGERELATRGRWPAWSTGNQPGLILTPPEARARRMTATRRHPRSGPQARCRWGHSVGPTRPRVQPRARSPSRGEGGPSSTRGAPPLLVSRWARVGGCRQTGTGAVRAMARHGQADPRSDAPVDAGCHREAQAGGGAPSYGGPSWWGRALSPQNLRKVGVGRPRPKEGLKVPYVAIAILVSYRARRVAISPIDSRRPSPHVIGRCMSIADVPASWGGRE